jgi:hypothetical protein
MEEIMNKEWKRVKEVGKKGTETDRAMGRCKERKRGRGKNCGKGRRRREMGVTEHKYKCFLCIRYGCQTHVLFLANFVTFPVTWSQHQRKNKGFGGA